MIDRRKIILKRLYDTQSNDATKYCDIKPLMNGWTKDEINHTIDSLTHKHPKPLINCPHTGERDYPRIGTIIQGIEVVTLENYTAIAYITPEGERHYEDVYKDINWKRFILMFDAVSKPVLLLVSIGSICLSILSWRTNERLRKEVVAMQDSIRKEVAQSDQNHKKDILELRKLHKLEK